MKAADYKIVSVSRLFTGPVFEVDREIIIFPDGREMIRDVVHHRGAVGVVPVTKDGRLMLINQYRQPARDVIIELPAGVPDKNETPESAALRELKEETGATASELIKLSEFYTTPGYSNEYFHLFLALGVELGQQELEGDEVIDVMFVSFREARAMIDRSEIKDGKTILGIVLAEKHIAENADR